MSEPTVNRFCRRLDTKGFQHCRSQIDVRSRRDRSHQANLKSGLCMGSEQ
ncbi:MAG: hypothetical protein ACPG7R_04115 [Planctomycetota bacterium]